MANFKLAVAVATFSLVAASAFAAPKVLGTWKGKIHVSAAALARIPPQYQAQVKAQTAMLEKKTILLSIAKNNTYTLMMAGGPAKNKDAGTWASTGPNSITLKSAKSPAPPQLCTISKNGKTMTILAPNGGGSLVFTR